jgi:hypothetical protein
MFGQCVGVDVEESFCALAAARASDVRARQR